MKDLLRYFHEAVQTVEDVELLKKKILELAVRGKLVKQDPNDEPASVLLERIQEEKERLIKEKKIKRTKPLPPILQDEIPYELPINWEWVRLEHVTELNDNAIRRGPFGSAITKSMFVPKGYNTFKVYEQKNAINQDAHIGDYYITKEKFESLNRFKVIPGDIIISCAGTIGKTYLLPNNAPPGIMNQALLKLRMNKSVIDNQYFLYLFDSLLLGELDKSVKGSAMKNMVSIDYLKNKLSIPLPPVKEQKRIVLKVDKLMALCDQLANDIRQKVKVSSSFNQSVFTRIQNPLNPNPLKDVHFTIDHMNDLLQTKENVRLFRNSVLSLATQGKLVPQDPSDEPASVLLEQIREEKEQLVKERKITKSKPLPPIAPNELPFKLPECWKWVRLGEICTYIQRGKSPTYSTIRKYPVVSQKCIQWDGFEFDKVRFVDPETINSYQDERFLQDGDLLWNSTGTGTIGRINLFKHSFSQYQRIVADSHVTVIRSMQSLESKYFLYWFMSPYVQSRIEEIASGTTKQKELNTKTVRDHIVPLPPVNEQKRIVSKVDELLVLCSQLEHQIEQCESNGKRLMQSVLKAALAKDK